MTTTPAQSLAADIIEAALAPHVRESLPHRPTWRADQARALAEDLHDGGLLAASPAHATVRLRDRDRATAGAAAVLQARLSWSAAERVAAALDAAGLLAEGAVTMTTVKPGQVWQDCDKRGYGRHILVETIEPAQPGTPSRAVVVDCDIAGRPAARARRTRIRLSRFRPTSNGYRLITGAEEG